MRLFGFLERLRSKEMAMEVEEEEALMVDCCLLFSIIIFLTRLLLLSSLCVCVCVLFVVCLCVFRFKLSSDLIVSGTIVLGTHKKFVQVIWYKCRLLSFMPSKIPIACRVQCRVAEFYTE